MRRRKPPHIIVLQQKLPMTPRDARPRHSLRTLCSLQEPVQDGVSSDDSTPGLFTPPASVGDAQPVPTRTVATAAGRPSAFFLHTHCDPAPAAGSHRRVRDGGGSESHFSHPPYDTAPAADSHRGARADDEPESRLLHAGGESEPHLSHTHYELAPHLLHPRHDPVPTADSHRGARVGGASESNLLHTRYDPAFAVAAAAARPPSAVFLRTRYDPAPDTDSHQGARTGGASESHFSTTPPLTTADPSATATSAATTFVASSSPDATEGSADHFSAPAPPAAEIPQRRTRPLPRRRPPPLPLPFMFLRALKTAPWPLPPPLAWLWVPPTESRRLPLPPPRLIRMSTGPGSGRNPGRFLLP